MLQVDLSTLSGPELRQLLDTTRARGQADLSYRILQEMAVRREQREAGRSRSATRRRRNEPRMIELELGDPLEPSADTPVEREPPLEPEPEPPLELNWHKPADPGPPPRRVRKIGFAAGITVGVVVGFTVGLGVAETTLQPAAPAAAPPLATLLSPPRSPAPAPAPVTEVQPAPQAPTEAPPPQAELAETTTPPPAAAASGEAADEPTPAEPAGVTPVVAAKACAAAPTPADRAICEDPDLQRLQRELRQAYADALGAHEDRELLREHQLAWRDARNTISDPARLTQLYEQRIRKLNAATADARRQR